MKIIQVPIEPIESRYSVDWCDWFNQTIRLHSINHVNVTANPLTKDIETGSFLDVYGTNYYKSQQAQKIAQMLYNNEIKDDDIFLFHDLWSPSVINLAYMRSASGINFKICGCLHAGTWDKHDFLTKVGMKEWADGFETSLFQIADAVFVATEFHKNLILDDILQQKLLVIDPGFSGIADKIKVTGFPIFKPETDVTTKAPSQITFPHRLDPEKQPELCDYIEQKLKSTSLLILKTKECCDTKQKYYDVLARSTYAISMALQETWGIAMQEALFLDNIVFVPERLSYAEMFHSDLQYHTVDELVDKLIASYYHYDYREQMIKASKETKQELMKKGKQAIPNILKEIEKL